MAWPDLLVFIRHAESEGNVVSVADRPKIAKGSYLYDLTERGRTQARITGDYVRMHFAPFDIRYCSYYTRTRQTMELVFPNERMYEDSRLAEAQRGIWHTFTREEIDRMYPGESPRKEREGLYHYRPIGGENWPDVEMRIHSFLGTLARDGTGKRIAIGAHGHWLILFQKFIEHFSIDEAMRRYKAGVIANASVTVYRPRVSWEKVDYVVPWQEDA